MPLWSLSGPGMREKALRIADEIRNLTAKSAEAVQNTNDLISRFRIQ
jgi:hypothetical protein